MKKLCVIVETYPARTELFIYRGLAELRRIGVEVEIFSLRSGDGADLLPGVSRTVPRLNPLTCMTLVPLLWQAGGTVFRLLGRAVRDPSGMGRGLYHTLRAGLLARQLFRKRDAVHLHAEFAGLPARYARLAAGILGIDYTVSAHARDVLAAEHDAVQNLDQARFVLFCTATVRDAASRLVPGLAERTDVVHHGIDVSAAVKPRSAFADDVLRVAAVGRFVAKKGYENLIRACALLAQRKVRVQCVFAGDGPRLEACRSLAAELGVADGIRFAGYLDSPAVDALYHQSDVLCVPSVRAADGDMDGIPNVILEAGRLGVPAVVSDLPGIAEAVTDGANGICVAAGDPEALGAGLERYLGLPPSAKKKLSAGARAAVEEKFDVQKNMQQWVALFRERGVAL